MIPDGVSPAPASVLEMIKCNCASESPCSRQSCTCASAKLSCNKFCNCHSNTCFNVWTNKESADLSDVDDEDGEANGEDADEDAEE